MKVIIAGGRSFNDYNKLKQTCNFLFQNKTDIEIVSGTANGADRLGERYAHENSHRLTQFPADWDNYGKSAGYIRNKQMAEYADALVAFWDGISKGTLHMINLAREKKLMVRVVRY